MHAAAIHALPNAHHVVIMPQANWLELIQEGEFDRICGYSLGSLLLLDALSRGCLSSPVILLAPIFNFDRYAGVGSRVAKTQLKVLIRWLRRDPLAAIHDFYQQAELPIGPLAELPYALTELLWGLDALLTLQVPLTVAQDSVCVVGAQDRLLDSDYLRTQLPHTVVVANGTHDIQTLSQALATTAASG